MEIQARLPGHPPSVLTQNAQNPAADSGGGGWGAAQAAASVAFASVLSVYLLLRPPLYNYDGYIYRFEALLPAQGSYINPHHLLWYPLQRAIAAVTSAAAAPSPEAFQLFGIFINCLTLALFCLLLARLTRRMALPLAITIFIAFSPRIWSLGLQNQPYPLLDLCVVGFLWTVAEWHAPSRLRLAASGLALAAAVLLQQAMVLAIPAVATGFLLAGAGTLKAKVKLAAAWMGCALLGVGTAYTLMAHVAGVKPAGFLNWTLLYLQEQHGIQLQWPQSAIKSVIGMAGTVVETSWVHDMCEPQESSEAIWRLFGGLLLLGCAFAAAILARRRVRERLIRVLRSNVAATSAAMLVLAWSAFVFLWEPTGYYWSVNLFPLAFLAAWWLRGSKKRTALWVAGVLAVVSGWNLYANHRQDQAYSVNFPPPLLEQARAQLGPHDVFIVAGRDWYANLDYSLLLECLAYWPRNPARALLDDYVMKGTKEQWQEKLDTDIRAAWAAGGRVYVADHIFWPESYSDLEQTADPFSEYAHLEYAGLGGDQLAGEIKGFFGRYKLCESGFKIGTDPFCELKKIE
jgi:hypothetical protein